MVERDVVESVDKGTGGLHNERGAKIALISPLAIIGTMQHVAEELRSYSPQHRQPSQDTASSNLMCPRFLSNIDN